jgi:hypothetical protein
MNAVVWGCAGLAVLGTLHALVNAVLLRRPSTVDRSGAGNIAVLLPVRNEADRVEPCVRSLLGQTAWPRMELIVLDDGSTDSTGDTVARLLSGHPGTRLLRGPEPPPGWLGKPHACQLLADAADKADVLVFVDADVVLEPYAIDATVALLERTGLDLVSPYPRQRTGTAAERLVQPLLQWSWLTYLPLRLAERSRRTSLAAANGQLLAVRRAAYYRAGGHRAVRDQVLDDIALARAVKRTGGRGGIVDGTHLAACRMYSGWREVWAGYTKSLWAPGAVALTAVSAIVYVLPLAAALAGGTVAAGIAAYLAGVAGRIVTAARTGGRVADAAAHPLSIVGLAVLTAGAVWRRHRGTLTWRGRPV